MLYRRRKTYATSNFNSDCSSPLVKVFIIQGTIIIHLYMMKINNEILGNQYKGFDSKVQRQNLVFRVRAIKHK